MNAKELRQRARNGENFTTSGLAKGNVQTNVVIIPKSQAFDFMLFCIRNPKPCPIVEVFDPGNFRSSYAKDSKCDPAFHQGARCKHFCNF